MKNSNWLLSKRSKCIKFIAPNKDEIPAKCRLKIAKSTDAPEWACIPANGG